MPISPDGKYDHLSINVLAETRARAAIVLIIGGVNGSGMSVATIGDKELKLLPTMLRELADGIERDAEHAKRMH